ARTDGGPGFYFLQARHLEGLGKVAEAIAALKQAIALSPDSAELQAELAGLYARQDRPVDALNTAEAAVKLDPDNREANRILGTIFAALADQKKALRPGDAPAQYQALAIAALEKARRDGGDLNIDLNLGRLELRAGAFDKAIQTLRRVFAEQPDYPEGAMLLSAAQESAQRTDDAILTLATALEYSPSFFRGHVRLIELYERQRRWKEAAGAYANAEKANARADLTSGHAAALLNAGVPDQARDLLEGVLAKRTSPDAGLLYLLAEAQRQTKDVEGAAATAQKLRAAFPDDPRALALEAQLMLSRGRIDDAISAYAALVTRVPDQASFVYQYAQLLEQAGRIPEAEKALRDLITKDPLDANALNSLGYLFADRGERLDEAVNLLQRAVVIEPGNPSFQDSLGWAFYKQGRLEQADGPLSDAASRMPANSVIQDHLGDLRWKQGRFAEAISAWERALGGDGEAIDRTAVEKKLRDARARLPRK
ncbi:MAG: tetratricopeptide repeat protein, partial [Vicinamibacterales bacterium]